MGVPPTEWLEARRRLGGGADSAPPPDQGFFRSNRVSCAIVRSLPRYPEVATGPRGAFRPSDASRSHAKQVRTRCQEQVAAQMLRPRIPVKWQIRRASLYRLRFGAGSRVKRTADKPPATTPDATTNHPFVLAGIAPRARPRVAAAARAAANEQVTISTPVFGALTKRSAKRATRRIDTVATNPTTAPTTAPTTSAKATNTSTADAAGILACATPVPIAAVRPPISAPVIKPSERSSALDVDRSLVQVLNTLQGYALVSDFG